MSNFAKVYETEQYGQIVAIKQLDDSNDPEIRFYFKPPGLGVCATALTFGDGDDDESYERQDKAWELVTEESALSVIQPTLAMLDEAGFSDTQDEE